MKDYLPLDLDPKVARLVAADEADAALAAFEREYPNDTRPRAAIEAARGYADGDTSAGALMDAYLEALGAFQRCTYDMAYSVTSAAHWRRIARARSAAHAAAWVAAPDGENHPRSVMAANTAIDCARSLTAPPLPDIL